MELASAERDILQAVDHGDIAALVLLGVSAAFDTADQSLHLVGALATDLRYWRHSSLLVSVLPVVQEEVRTSRSQQVVSHLPDLWRATRIDHFRSWFDFQHGVSY